MLDFFTTIKNTKPYLKVAFEGFPGSGKTVTMAKLGIGLHKRIQSKKPVVMLDTERANQWLAPLFKADGVPVQVRETRAFSDLQQAMKLCSDGYADILLIDSISHFWQAVIDAQLKHSGKKRMTLPAWGIVGDLWKREFNTPMVDAPYHILFAGRAGDEWATEENEDGEKESFKTGRMKMKAHGETGYEPDALIAMARCEEGVIKGDLDVYREARILKSRCPEIDGKTFQYRSKDNPDKVYKDFSPLIEAVLCDASFTLPNSSSDEQLFPTEEARQDYNRRRTILTEEIVGLLTSVWPGKTAVENKNKSDILDLIFQTRSWTAIESMSVERLGSGIIDMKRVMVERGLLTPPDYKPDPQLNGTSPQNKTEEVPAE